MTLPVLVSPVEIVRTILLANSDLSGFIGGNVFVGPAPVDVKAANGAIVLADAGNFRVEVDVPVIHNRIMVRCIAPTIDRAETIGRLVYAALHARNRFVVPTQASLGWLVHFTAVQAGPSLAVAEDELWTTNLFVQISVGTEPCQS